MLERKNVFKAKKIFYEKRIDGMHDALAYMDEMMDLDGLVLQQEVVEYPHAYFESMHFDFIGRSEGDEWPE